MIPLCIHYAASQSFMRILLWIKTADVMLCSHLYKWAPTETERENGDGKFNIAACIILSLFLKAGGDTFPGFDDKFLAKHVEKLPKTGWNEAYKSLPDAYHSSLLQTVPQSTKKGTRKKKLNVTPHAYVQKSRLGKHAELGKKERQPSSASDCSTSPQK